MSKFERSDRSNKARYWLAQTKQITESFPVLLETVPPSSEPRLPAALSTANLLREI